MGGCCSHLWGGIQGKEGWTPDVTVLPPEILERVFHLLPPRDLKAVVLVCRRWREVGEVPVLWTWVATPFTQTNFSSDLGLVVKMLKSRRLEWVNRANVRKVSEEFLEVAISHPGLKTLDMSNTNVSDMNSSLLSRAITGMDEADLGRSTLTRQQAAHMFTALAEHTVPLKRLNLFKCDISSVDPGLVGRGLAKLEAVTLWHSCLTQQQAEAAFFHLAISGNMRRLDISYTNLSKVEAELLGGVVARLEAADLGCTSLRVEQVEAILTSILHTSSLASLWISGVQGKVDRDLVNQAHMVVPQLRVL